MDYASRLAALRRRAEEVGADRVILTGGADLLYVSGYRAMPLERITALVVSPTDAVLFVPALEAPRVAPGPFELLAWEETADPLDLIAGKCRGSPTIALSDQTWSIFLLGLVDRLPGVRFVSATPLLRAARAHKSQEEVERLAAGGCSLDRVARRLPGLRYAGRSERAVARDVTELIVAEGHDLAVFWIVASGPNSASPHHEPGERLIAEGDLVIIDYGGRLEDYCSDCTRTFVVGEPTAEQRRIHDIVRAAQEASIGAVRPGVTAASIDAVARGVIGEAGLGDRFIHRTGHGIGLEGHEHPYLVAGNEETIEEGMCFSIEPGIYLPDRFGVRIEDIVAVTATGVRLLNQSPRDLISVA